MYSTVQTYFFQVYLNHVSIHIKWIINQETKSFYWIFYDFCKFFYQFCRNVWFWTWLILTFYWKLWFCKVFKSVDTLTRLTKFTVNADEFKLKINCFQEWRKLIGRTYSSNKKDSILVKYRLMMVLWC